MLPQTDLHKIVGYFVAIAAGYALKYGFDVPADVQASVTLGVALLVSTLIGKKTNPTGANSSKARVKLEQGTGTGSGGLMDYPLFKLKPDEVAMIYGILLRYPAVFEKKYEWKWGPFGPSARVKNVVRKLIGENPLDYGGSGVVAFSTRTMSPSDWDEIEHFQAGEFKSPGNMGFEFVRWLDRVRADAGVAMPITSSYRSPRYNLSVGGADASAHCDIPCSAVDIGMTPRPDDPNWNLSRYQIVSAAMRNGCQRIGTYTNGSLHLDRTEDRRPAPRMWRVVRGR